MEKAIKVLQSIIKERKLVLLRNQYIRHTLCIFNPESLSLACSQIVIVERKIKLANTNKKIEEITFMPLIFVIIDFCNN
jgi:hypothetical protein